jgi:hypothetical protein
MELAERKSSAIAAWIDRRKDAGMSHSRFAICIDNSEYPASLERHRIYRVIDDDDADRDGDLRVIDESGEDDLYPADCFLPVELPRDTVAALERSFAPNAPAG